jgi:hypothetical protein
VWYAEKLENVRDRSVTPEEVLEKNDPATYVYFARNPSPPARRRLAQCIRFKGGPDADITKIDVH